MLITFSCRCGSVEGSFTATRTPLGPHFVCLCDDCQAYAHYLGHAKEVLDRNGGTDVIPVAPAHLTIDKGKGLVKCLRLSEKGMFRWYAGCCQTPIANSMSAKLGYIGAFTQTVTGRDPSVLGPVTARVMARFGIPPIPEGAHTGTPMSLVTYAVKATILEHLKGLKKPNPFFEPGTGQPIVAPYILSSNEREQLLKKVDAARGQKAPKI